MPRTKCRECQTGELEIMGTGTYGDTIEVECQSCGECYEVEPDGLGDAGFEMVDAQMIEMEKNTISGKKTENDHTGATNGNGNPEIQEYGSLA